MSIIVTQSQVIHCVEYGLSFRWKGAERDSGFSFDCDEMGKVDRSKFAPEAIENLDKCLDGTFDVVFEGVEKREWHYREPAVGRCSCGEEVWLEHFTNTCECGRDYDKGGNLLAPREQWGEETGEHISDILRIP